ncbi:MAG: restriction endonuclease subunit S [Erysipelotrichaceae bacterium]|nr:restriction endonuclease subunit S [Erysipelotrichaceae bacterium]
MENKFLFNKENLALRIRQDSFKTTDNTPYEKIGDAKPVSVSDELPFDIPDSWEWVRIKDVFEIEMGQSPAGSSVHDGSDGIEFHQGKIFFGERFLERSNQVTDSPTKYAKPGSILLCVRAPVGKINITDRIICIGRGLCSLKPLNGLSMEYVYYLLETYEPLFVKQSTGTTFKAITGEVVKNQLIPLPPLPEQKRIVEKLNSIMPLISNYGVRFETLQQFNNAFPDQLKKSILQLAVQGKLVPQDPNDEPASVLLQRIRVEKERLIREGKIKRDKNESVIFRRDNSHYEKQGNIERCIDNELPFEIPENWEWVRWGSLSESIQYGFNAPAQDSGRIKMVRISDIQNNSVLWNTVPYCDIAETDIETYLLQKNDILFARTGGTVGKSFLVDEVPEESIYAGYLIRTRYSSLLSPQYLKLFMESPLYWNQLKEGTTATAQPNCNGKTLGKMFIPIPPASEQLRIVKAVNSAFSAISAL